MEWQNTFSSIENLISSNVLNLLGALAVFVLGWVLALLVSSLVKKMVKEYKCEAFLAKWLFEGNKESAKSVITWSNRAVYLFVLFAVLIIGIKVLNLTAINDQIDYLIGLILGFGVKITKPFLLLVTAWILASIIRFLILKVSGKVKIEDRLQKIDPQSKAEKLKVTSTFAETVYWLVFLVFLPSILEALSLENLTEPFNRMVETIIDYLPNLFGALIIFFIGWFLAKIVQRVLTNLMHSMGLDKLGDRTGMKTLLGDVSLSEVIGVIAYVLIIIPVLISALNALKLEAITGPASDMLNEILALVPNIFGAIIILFVAYFVGKTVNKFVVNFLGGIGFDNVLIKMGVSKEPLKGRATPSEILGFLASLSIMLFASIEALDTIGLATLADIAGQLMGFGAQVLLGLFVLAVGLYIANLAGSAVSSSNLANGKILGAVARVAIIILTGAMALREMGIAGEIVNITFGIILAGLALAFGLAMGLGGRDMAAKYLKEIEKNFNK